MTDIEIVERVARWCGLDYKNDGGIYSFTHERYFNPLVSWSDLMTIVVPRLRKPYGIWIYSDHFYIDKGDVYIKDGNFPDEFPRTICTMIAEEGR